VFRQSHVSRNVVHVYVIFNILIIFISPNFINSAHFNVMQNFLFLLISDFICVFICHLIAFKRHLLEAALCDTSEVCEESEGERWRGGEGGEGVYTQANPIQASSEIILI